MIRTILYMLIVLFILCNCEIKIKKTEAEKCTSNIENLHVEKVSDGKSISEIKYKKPKSENNYPPPSLFVINKTKDSLEIENLRLDIKLKKLQIKSLTSLLE